MEGTLQDIQRVVANQRSLLETIPEMVLLVKDSHWVEYMNPSAKLFFGDLCRRNLNNDEGHNRLANLLQIVSRTIQDRTIGQTQEASFEQFQLEYTLAPFKGYAEDTLYWFFIRDLTEYKRQLEELSHFHNSIETILSHKINELKESERTRQKLASELNSLKEHLKEQPAAGKMVGSSRSLSELRDMVFQVAKSDATILITGESGTGKELVANLIRESSNRKDKPFLKINCNTINDSLLESDLFGHEKGAFTGADSKRKGKFEVVDGGTIFLDEIGDISPRMQAALLRVLQDGDIIRVGGNSPTKIDVRVIAATNLNLASMVQNGTFRLDLYYRLNIINISIPPLRERKEDIIDLTTHFIRKYRQAFKKDINFLPQSILDRLLLHSWPGNVRELENVIQRAVLMAKNNMISENELFFDSPMDNKNEPQPKNYLQQINGKTLKDMVADFEKDILLYTLENNHGNVPQTVKQLNIGKTAFYDKMKRHNISTKTLK
jgi:transcriptional regulator with PAS, ATPase and Fis domain